MKLAWAFNPFDDNRNLQKNASALLRLLRRRGGTLEAVYVASPGETELATSFNVPETERFAGYPRRLVESALHRLGLVRSKVTVLTRRDLSLTASVRAIAGHLARARPDLTLVASHARRGISRLFLGSFAETLIHLSRTNLLVFNERTRIRPKVGAILFAHDLSAESDKGLRKAIEYAKAWRCELHVIHVPEPAYKFELGSHSARAEALRREVGQRLRGIEARTKRAGLKGSARIDPEWSPISELILRRAARVRAGMVAVVAKSGRLAGLMGGSVTRKVVRESPVPVLIIKR